METKQVVTLQELADIDRQFQNVTFESVQAESGAAGQMEALDIAGKLASLCKFLKKIKPVLSAIVSIPFVPGKDAIKSLISLIGTIC